MDLTGKIYIGGRYYTVHSPRFFHLVEDGVIAAILVSSVNQLSLSHFMLLLNDNNVWNFWLRQISHALYYHAIFWGTEGLGEGCVKIMQIVSCLELMANLFIFIHNGGI